ASPLRLLLLLLLLLPFQNQSLFQPSSPTDAYLRPNLPPLRSARAAARAALLAHHARGAEARAGAAVVPGPARGGLAAVRGPGHPVLRRDAVPRGQPHP